MGISILSLLLPGEMVSLLDACTIHLETSQKLSIENVLCVGIVTAEN